MRSCCARPTLTVLVALAAAAVSVGYAAHSLTLDQGSEMPLDYKMRNTNDRWQVYDLSIDGIGLMSNYRAQFNKIIRTSSYEALVTSLKSRQTEVSAPAAAASGAKPVR